MNEIRKVKRIIRGMNATDGAGVKLVRVVGYRDTKDFDPFLMLDAFDSSNPEDYVKGFPWHPHRGIETITYLIEGKIEHSDSLGNVGVIESGDCQWMTAGSGIIHQEMPQPSKRMLGAQLWLNLPAKDKMTEPSYGDIKKEDIPVVDKEGNKVHVISGEYLGVKGTFEGKYVKATYLDVEIESNSEWYYDSKEDETLFIYIIQGEASFNPNDNEIIHEKQAVLFSTGSRLWVKGMNNGIRFLLLHGEPLNEPIAWGGPIVMNTSEELQQAFLEIERGDFIK